MQGFFGANPRCFGAKAVLYPGQANDTHSHQLAFWQSSLVHVLEGQNPTRIQRETTGKLHTERPSAGNQTLGFCTVRQQIAGALNCSNIAAFLSVEKLFCREQRELKRIFPLITKGHELSSDSSWETQTHACAHTFLSYIALSLSDSLTLCMCMCVMQLNKATKCCAQHLCVARSLCCRGGEQQFQHSG